jgi:hypothetical protein
VTQEKKEMDLNLDRLNKKQAEYVIGEDSNNDIQAQSKELNRLN